jgi:hypothetical protein
MTNETLTVDAVAFSFQTIDLNEVETLEEAAVAGGSSAS